MPLKCESLIEVYMWHMSTIEIPKSTTLNCEIGATENRFSRLKLDIWPIQKIYFNTKHTNVEDLLTNFQCKTVILARILKSVRCDFWKFISNLGKKIYHLSGLISVSWTARNYLLRSQALTILIIFLHSIYIHVMMSIIFFHKNCQWMQCYDDYL